MFGCTWINHVAEDYLSPLNMVTICNTPWQYRDHDILQLQLLQWHFVQMCNQATASISYVVILWQIGFELPVI